MKKIIYLLLFYIGGCTESPSPQGTYTCNYANEFYSIHDTLILKSINKKIFQIERRTGANKKIKLEKWTLTYDEEKKLLAELKKGKIVVILNGNLIYGNRIYKKIKE